MQHKRKRPTQEIARTVSRHSLAYILCAISELFRHYDFDPIDLLIIHAVLNANVINVMRDGELDHQFSGLDAVEPDAIKQGVSRAALSRFLNLPLETIRRRVNGLMAKGILVQSAAGLIVTEHNQYTFGNNHHLQNNNIVLVRKLLRDLAKSGIESADDL